MRALPKTLLVGIVLGNLLSFQSAVAQGLNFRLPGVGNVHVPLAAPPPPQYPGQYPAPPGHPAPPPASYPQSAAAPGPVVPAGTAVGGGRFVVAPDLFVMISGTYPAGYGPKWSLIGGNGMPVRFEVTDFLVRHPLSDSDMRGVYIGNEAGRAVLGFDDGAIGGSKCVAYISLPPGGVVLGPQPSTFALANIHRPIAGGGAEACSRRGNHYFYQWSGQVTLSASPTGDIMMSLVLDTFSDRGAQTYRHAANNVLVANMTTPAVATAAKQATEAPERQRTARAEPDKTQHADQTAAEGDGGTSDYLKEKNLIAGAAAINRAYERGDQKQDLNRAKLLCSDAHDIERRIGPTDLARSLDKEWTVAASAQFEIDERRDPTPPVGLSFRCQDGFGGAFTPGCR
jgi:hypothetical protein